MHNSVIVFEHIDFINVGQTLKTKLAQLFVEGGVIVGVLLWWHFLRSPGGTFASGSSGVSESLLEFLSRGEHGWVVHVDIFA